MTTTIADGTYFLHPEGSAWIAAAFRGGRLVAEAHECDAGSHDAANDTWSGVRPTESDREVSSDMADAIIRVVMGEDVIPELVVVTVPQ